MLICSTDKHTIQYIWHNTRALWRCGLYLELLHFLHGHFRKPWSNVHLYIILVFLTLLLKEACLTMQHWSNNIKVELKSIELNPGYFWIILVGIRNKSDLFIITVAKNSFNTSVEWSRHCFRQTTNDTVSLSLSLSLRHTDKALFCTPIQWVCVGLKYVKGCVTTRKSRVLKSTRWNTRL